MARDQAAAAHKPRGVPEAQRNELKSRADAIRASYDELSAVYQDSKDGNAIPLN
ncbi:hypothetical protein [Ensifer sp. B1-9]|uniref:hypothetical protein n=1 Tax=Ensifer sp. B1-9 TaxID=3141455 RepID=UPI003D1F4D65